MHIVANPKLGYSIDVAAISAIVGAFMGYMPSVAALFSVIWIGCNIYTWAFVTKGWKRK
jgi:hypothetical protein